MKVEMLRRRFRSIIKTYLDLEPSHLAGVEGSFIQTEHQSHVATENGRLMRLTFQRTHRSIRINSFLLALEESVVDLKLYFASP